MDIFDYQANRCYNKPHMTNLETKIKERGLTFYQIIKHLGGDPLQTQGHFSRKVRGIRGMTLDELHKICKAISELSDTPLTPEEVNKDIILIKVL